MLTIIYIHAVTLYLHTQGRFNNHTMHSYYRIPVRAAMSWRVMKMGNIVLKVGIKPASLGFQANVLTITPPRDHHMHTYLSIWLLA